MEVRVGIILSSLALMIILVADIFLDILLKESFISQTIAYVVFLIPLAFSIFDEILFRKKLISMSDWKSCNGVIIEEKEVRFLNLPFFPKKIRLKYKYSAQGRDYVSSQVALMQKAISINDLYYFSTNLAKDKVKVGKNVKVYYEKNKPWSSVLTKKTSHTYGRALPYATNFLVFSLYLNAKSLFL